MTHELKCWPEYFNKVRSGDKTFEVRKNDRGFQVGDSIWLHEWEPHDEQYTGKSLLVKITYILNNHIGIQEGYIVFGIRAKGGIFKMI